MGKYILYRCEGYDILERDKRQCIVCDRKTQKYYSVKKAFSEMHINFVSIEKVRVQYIDIFFYIFFLTLPYIIYNLTKKIFTMEWVNAEIDIYAIFLGIIFLICNIILHEFAHFLMMKCYGRRVKFNMPKIEGQNIKFHVDTTSSYLLPKYKRFAVYTAGAMANIYFVYIMLCFSKVSPYTMLFSLVFIIINLVPSKELPNDASCIIAMARQ